MFPLPSSFTIPLSTTSHSHSPQVETEMEAALKTSFRKEMVFPQAFMEELSGFNGGQNDDFSVDDLLDFSHAEEEEEPEQQQQQQKVEQEDSASACVSLQQTREISKPAATSNHHPFKDDFAPVLPTGELTVPVDDVADLEWLSHFVEDSEFSAAAAFPAAVALPVNPKKEPKPEPEPENPVFAQPCFRTPVQTKARSKRTRNGVRVWPLGSPETSSSSTTTTTTSSSSSSPSSPLVMCTSFPLSGEQVCSLAAARPPPAKRPKRNRNPCSDQAAPRRCSHCGVQKTPQWRTGPHGAKTLCNACGVRFKSGRLLPEYRPACSPTFSSELHSNHHRKVLEMRRKKEEGEVETGLSTVIPSF